MATCNLCVSFGPQIVKYNSHLAEAHAKAHYTQLNHIIDEISLNETIQKCFPDGSIITRETMQDELSRERLMSLCRSMFSGTDGKSTSNAVCEKCGASIKIFDKGNLVAGRIIDHACSHSKHKLYKFRICIREFSTNGAVVRHLTHKHNMTSIGNYDNRLRHYVDAVFLEIKSCFSAVKSEKDSDEILIRPCKGHTRMSKLANQRRSFCLELLSTVADKRTILCRLCATRTKVGVGESRTIMEHALLHLRKPINRCTFCSERYTNRSSMRVHLKTRHSLPLANNYERLDDQYHSEIMSLLTQCYGNDKRRDQPKVSMSARSESDVLRRLKGSKLTAERQLLCYRLVRNSIGDDKKIECRLCKKRLCSTNVKGYISCDKGIQHALVHLKKPNVRCKICSKTYWGRDMMVDHLKKKHALPIANNTISLADEYHSEIVAILHACYGNETD